MKTGRVFQSKRSAVIFTAVLIAAAVLISVLAVTVLLNPNLISYNLSATAAFTQTDKPLDNPLTGYAPPAENEPACKDSRLVFIRITWAEWEPAQGHYDIEGLEEKYHIARWKEENKHAVLRFMCDVPGDEGHLDIPGWLYDRTQDGSYYDVSYGKGYCPNYENTFFREMHTKAIRALAEYCNQDYFVSYVELGSLGHWGEWHTDTEADALPLPDANICRQYISDYTGSFRHARLLTRRNYSIAADSGLGLYNDMVGSTAATAQWLGWLEHGGSYSTNGSPLTLAPVGCFWEYAPVGGELTSEYPVQELFSRHYSNTLETVNRSHMTFIGPNCPVEKDRESAAASELRERLGYRYYISELSMETSPDRNHLDVALTWNNAGLAPLYWDWPVTMYIYDRNGEQLYFQAAVDLDLSALVPDKQIVTHTEIPLENIFLHDFQIGIGVASPDGLDHIRLAMDTVILDDHIQILYAYQG